MKKERSKLLYPTFDGDVQMLGCTPERLKTKCAFRLAVWDELAGERKGLGLDFHHVAALEFSLNLCDSYIGADLGGFYEIFGKKQKKKLLERNFDRKRKSWLLPGNYEYDEKDSSDSLNYRKELDKLEKKLDKYHLYLLESSGGSYLILAKGYTAQEQPGREAQTEGAFSAS